MIFQLNSAQVAGALVLVADAFLLGMPIVPARARIHRSHQHKRRWIFGTVFRPRNRDNPVLQWLAHHFQNGAIEFRQFIQVERLAPFPCLHHQCQHHRNKHHIYHESIHNHKDNAFDFNLEHPKVSFLQRILSEAKYDTKRTHSTS